MQMAKPNGKEIEQEANTKKELIWSGRRDSNPRRPTWKPPN